MNLATTRVFAIASVAIVSSVSLPQCSWAAGEAKSSAQAGSSVQPAAASSKPMTEEERLAKKAADAKKPLLKQSFNEQEVTPLSSVNMKALRRLDFRIVGKTCAVCLLGIQKRLRKTPGVAKVAVMIKKPYGGVAIYDSSKVSKDALLNKIKEGEKEVKIEEPVDTQVDKIPLVVIPKYHNLNGIDDSSLGSKPTVTSP